MRPCRTKEFLGILQPSLRPSPAPTPLQELQLTSCFQGPRSPPFSGSLTQFLRGSESLVPSLPQELPLIHSSQRPNTRQALPRGSVSSPDLTLFRDQTLPIHLSLGCEVGLQGDPEAGRSGGRRDCPLWGGRRTCGGLLTHP